MSPARPRAVYALLGKPVARESTGLYPRKGVIAPESDADPVLWSRRLAGDRPRRPPARRLQHDLLRVR